VVDREAPSIICPADIVQASSAGQCDANITLTAPTFTDNCSVSAFKTSYRVISPDNSETAALTSTTSKFKVGISRVIWTLTDEAGNSSSCTQHVAITADPSGIQPNAGPDATICEGATYLLSGSSASNYTSLKWTTDGTGKFSDTGILHPVYTPSLTEIMNGQVVLRLTASSICASATSSMNLTINNISQVSAGLYNDVFSCTDAPVELNGTSKDVVSTLWSTSGTGTFTNAASLKTIYQPSAADLASGTIVLTITGVSNLPCAQSSDQLTLHLMKQAEANAGVDAAICEGSSYQLASASATNATSILWKTSGTGWFSNLKIANPTYIPSMGDILNGTVVLTMTANSSSPCGNVTDEMVLTISRKAIVSAGPVKDVSTCSGAVYQLSGTNQYTSTTVWSSSGTGTFTNAGQLNTKYTPSTADVAAGKVILTLTGLSNIPCGNSSDQLTLHFLQQATAGAGIDAVICEGSAYQLSTATASNVVSIAWKTSGTGIFSDPRILNPVYQPSATDRLNGVVYLTLTVGSALPCNGVQDEMMLNITKQPVADAGPSIQSCYGASVKITNAKAQNALNVLWTTNGKGTLTNSNTLTPGYQPASGEIGVVNFTLKAYGAIPCDAIIAESSMTVTYNRSIEVEIMAADTILYDTSALLEVFGTQGTGNYIYRWEPIALVPNFSSNRAETLPLTQDTKFTVTITDVLTGCSASKEVTIVVEQDIEALLDIFNGISPNGDGINDTWVIEGIEKFPDNDVMIFNRWGDKIIDIQNYNNTSAVWKGTNKNNKLVPDGTYYYIIKINKVNKTFTGFLDVKNGNNE
jgi:gliding motility-associated-like protein